MREGLIIFSFKGSPVQTYVRTFFDFLKVFFHDDLGKNRLSSEEGKKNTFSDENYMNPSLSLWLFRCLVWSAIYFVSFVFRD